jgi:hypothetical protein
MAATQLAFALRTTSAVKTVHLIGSWDGYQGQLPLSGSKGSWKGTFRFQTSILQPGQRYWFYYMIDGYQVSHDPSREFTTEPTTGRKLNILDVPASKSAAAAAAKRSSRRHSRVVPQGRAVSPSAMRCPKPQRPGQTAHIVAGDYTQATLEALNARFAQQSLDDDSDSDSDSDDDSDCSDVPSLSSASSRSDCSSPSSVASSCSCQRFGITRAGQRVLLDCGGSRCGASESDCSDSDSEKVRQYSTRRHGVVIRG